MLLGVGLFVTYSFLGVKPDSLEGRITWYEAEDYAARLRLGDHDDWRVPSIKELISLVDANGVMHRPRRAYFDERYFDLTYGPENIDGYRTWEENARIYLPGGQPPEVGKRFTGLCNTLRGVLEDQLPAAWLPRSYQASIFACTAPSVIRSLMPVRKRQTPSFPSRGDLLFVRSVPPWVKSLRRISLGSLSICGL